MSTSAARPHPRSVGVSLARGCLVTQASSAVVLLLPALSFYTEFSFDNSH